MKDFKKMFKKYQLESYYDVLKDHIKCAIHLDLTKIEENELKLGESKIGGLPDLPRNIDWFLNEETKTPMSFIAQINFSEVKAFDLDDKLPKSGIIYLFYDCSDDGMPWGYDPKDKSGKKVFYYEGNLEELERKKAPEGFEEYGLFDAAKLSFHSRMELPDYDSGPVERINLTDEECDRYMELREYMCDEEYNKILGHSDTIQNSMELECELVTNGLYCGDETGYRSPERKKLEKNIHNWNLLLQIDSNEDLGMMWGDCGKLYLWITEEALRNRQFDDSWLILQCC